MVMGGGEGGVGETGGGNDEWLVLMSSEHCRERWNHHVMHMKLMQHCVLTAPELQLKAKLKG